MRLFDHVELDDIEARAFDAQENPLSCVVVTLVKQLRAHVDEVERLRKELHEAECAVEQKEEQLVDLSFKKSQIEKLKQRAQALETGLQDLVKATNDTLEGFGS